MISQPESIAPEIESTRLAELSSSPFLRLLKYVFKRILTISLTVLLGVFIMVVIANHNGNLDQIIRGRIDAQLFTQSLATNFQLNVEVERQNLERKAGLLDPFLIKHLRYTLRALTFDWGDVTDRRQFNLWIKTSKGEVNTLDSRLILFSKLPNTLILSGTAYLLLALIGIPLALYLSQHEGRWLDRLTGILTPLSSIPSWVIGILLVLVFAVGFKIFPVSKMIGNVPPETPWEWVKTVAYHLVLPVTAIVLSQIFQLVYSWRTYLLIYSSEDYVALAKAKGLRSRDVDFRYIFKPALPFMITSLALSLVGFWQVTTALEYFFQWPGIGSLFVQALPNFHGERMYAGEMSIVLGIVVLFAYLLAITVFVLDIAYFLVDPRLGVETGEQKQVTFSDQNRKVKKGFSNKLFSRTAHPLSGSDLLIRDYAQSAIVHPFKRSFTIRCKEILKSCRKAVGNGFHEIRRVPTAMVGFSLAGILIVLSILVMILIPYNPTGKMWTESNLTGNPTRAKLALPVWVNWFRKNDLPGTLVMSSRMEGPQVQVTRNSTGASTKQIDFSFNYPYQEFPSDMAIYLTPAFLEKSPFITLTWVTPDGRQIQLKSISTDKEATYTFAENVPFIRLLAASEPLKKWVVTTGTFRTPEYYLLFADPQADVARVVPGTYHLKLEGIFFDEQSDFDAQFVVFGRVEGWAGTDYLRRDLLIPLLWGLPFALLIGVTGAVITSLISLILAAISAWNGAWIDRLIQHATEANLILPMVAIGVLLYSYFNISLWLIIGIIILSNVLGSTTKVFRAAFLQEKQAGYIEAAKVYGASDWKLIRSYLIPRILPAIIPQIVMMIPSYIFLEATLAIFNISDPRYPTWGRIIYSALRYGATYGSEFWVLEPISLMVLTGLAFVLIGFGLNRILNPRLR